MERGNEVSIPKITIDRRRAEWVEIAAYSYRRIALCEDDANVFCVESGQEELFKSGKPFRINPWSKKEYILTFTGEKVLPVKPSQKKETIKIGDYEFYKDDVEKRLNGLKPIV